MEVFKTQFLMSAAVIFHFLLVRLKRKGQIGLGNEVPQTLRPLCRGLEIYVPGVALATPKANYSHLSKNSYKNIILEISDIQ